MNVKVMVTAIGSLLSSTGTAMKQVSLSVRRSMTLQVGIAGTVGLGGGGCLHLLTGTFWTPWLKKTENITEC